MKKSIAWLSLLASPLVLALAGVQAPKAIMLLALFRSGTPLDMSTAGLLASAFLPILAFLGGFPNVLPALTVLAFLVIS